MSFPTYLPCFFESRNEECLGTLQNLSLQELMAWRWVLHLEGSVSSFLLRWHCPLETTSDPSLPPNLPYSIKSISAPEQLPQSLLWVGTRNHLGLWSQLQVQNGSEGRRETLPLCLIPLSFIIFLLKCLPLLVWIRVLRRNSAALICQSLLVANDHKSKCSLSLVLRRTWERIRGEHGREWAQDQLPVHWSTGTKVGTGPKEGPTHYKISPGLD